MKVDANDHAVYLVDEKQGAGGATPGTIPTPPSRQPRIYPAASFAPSGAGAVRQHGATDQTRAPAGGAQHDAGHAVSGEPKPDEPEKKPDKHPGNETTATHPDSHSPNPDLPVSPSSSVPPPSGNSLQFKAGGTISAMSSLVPGSGSAPGWVPRPGVIQRSNRAGHLTGLLISGVSKTIRDAGGVAHAKNKQEANQSGLQLGKSIANGVATAIDVSRVPHKKEMRQSFFGSPRRQGVYEVPRHPVHTGSGSGIVLKSMRNAPQDHGTQTVQPPTHEAGTQTPAPAAGNAKQDGGGAGQSTGSDQGIATQTASDHAGATGQGTRNVPDSVKGNGHWMLADGASLASDINNVKIHPNLTNIAGLGSSVVLTAGDTAALANASGNRLLTLTSKSLSLLGTTIGLAPSIGQLSSDVKQLIAHPNDEQSKWNVGNSAFQLGAGLAATAASLAFPPIALLPVVFPNLAEIGHAEILRGKKNALCAEGLKTEAGAVEERYKIAALDATPIINWFSSTYTPEMRPAIENFEMAQGNKPGNQPAGELPENTLHDQRVYDYYGQAISERADRLADAARLYLKGVASGSGLGSVTMVSRCPQVFGWPTNGQAMRVFDRAVAITYDSVHDTAHAEFFGADKDGTYRLPTRDPSLPSGKDSKNLVFYTDMLDRDAGTDAKQAKFDLPQYNADPTTFTLDWRKKTTARV